MAAFHQQLRVAKLRRKNKLQIIVKLENNQSNFSVVNKTKHRFLFCDMFRLVIYFKNSTKNVDFHDEAALYLFDGITRRMAFKQSPMQLLTQNQGTQKQRRRLRLPKLN